MSRDRIEHVVGRVWHGRQGGVRNAFAYDADYVLVDMESLQSAPALFSRNRRNIFAMHDGDHGGLPGVGRGAGWVRDLLDTRGLSRIATGRILLLTQPRILGHSFNPVSFWLVHDAAGALRCVISEVTNTYGDRHAYVCHRRDLGSIRPCDRLRTGKMLHVSPFQPAEGEYVFSFAVSPARVAIRVGFAGRDSGLLATLCGNRRPLGNLGILASCLKRPLGSRRVLALIHWQALKLRWNGARYRPRPGPPADGLS